MEIDAGFYFRLNALRTARNALFISVLGNPFPRFTYRFGYVKEIGASEEWRQKWNSREAVVVKDQSLVVSV
jgi:hypothetical protein